MSKSALVIEEMIYDSGTISAPAFLIIRVKDADGKWWNFELKGKKAKQAWKNYKTGDVFDDVSE